MQIKKVEVIVAILIAMIVGMLFLGFSGSDGSRGLQHAEFLRQEQAGTGRIGISRMSSYSFPSHGGGPTQGVLQTSYAGAARASPI